MIEFVEVELDDRAAGKSKTVAIWTQGLRKERLDCRVNEHAIVSDEQTLSLSVLNGSANLYCGFDCPNLGPQSIGQRRFRNTVASDRPDLDELAWPVVHAANYLVLSNLRDSAAAWLIEAWGWQAYP